MPKRKTKTRSGNVGMQEVEILRKTIQDGWPWRQNESLKFVNIPLSTRGQIQLSHLTGVFTMAASFPADPHPSEETVEFLRSELADDLKAAEAKWGKFVKRKDRWHSDDLRARNSSWGPREVY